VVTLGQLAKSPYQYEALSDTMVSKFWPKNGRSVTIEQYRRPEDGALFFRLSAARRRKVVGMFSEIVFVEDADEAALHFLKTGELKDPEARWRKQRRSTFA